MSLHTHPCRITIDPVYHWVIGLHALCVMDHTRDNMISHVDQAIDHVYHYGCMVVMTSCRDTYSYGKYKSLLRVGKGQHMQMMMPSHVPLYTQVLGTM